VEIHEVVARHSEHGLPRSYFAKEAPRTEVAVSAFAIGRTPVTVGDWRLFCVETGWEAPRRDPRLPIEDLPWLQAATFCEWASEAAGQAVRLPSEDEWERAARGDDVREYPWGDLFERRCANLAELGIGHALPVGSLPLGASPFGVLDLAGNVDEWTATEYYPYPGAPSDVPASERQAYDKHVTRGGGYIHRRDLARCARRHGIYASGGGAGFRVATSR
jgi:formylglycine-generating enzyme required for sulfatase activity